MTSFIAAGGSGRSASVIPASPAASSVTTIAFIRNLLYPALACTALSAQQHERNGEPRSTPLLARADRAFEPGERVGHSAPVFVAKLRSGETGLHDAHARPAILLLE